MKCKLNSYGETDYDISTEIEKAQDNVFEQLLKEIKHEIQLRTKYLFHNTIFIININATDEYLKDKLLDKFSNKETPYTVNWVGVTLEMNYVVRILSVVRLSHESITQVEFEIVICL